MPDVTTPLSLALAPTEAEALFIEVLATGNELRVGVRGASMKPVIRDGDAVVIAPAGGRQVEVGDIALMRREDGGVLVHRVVWRSLCRGEDMIFRTKGDSLRGLDRPARAADLVGRVVAIERAGTEKTVRLDTFFARLKARLRALLGLAAAGVRKALR